MFETYRVLGREREAELAEEAARLRPLAGRPLVRVWRRASPAEDTQRKERTMGITRLITRLRIYSAAIVATVVSVALVSPAAAEVWPDGRYGAKLSTQVPSSDARSGNTRVLAPDDLTRALPERSTSPPVPDFVDRYVESHRTDLARTTPTAFARHSGEGFDWGAAGVGASMTAALLLALGVGVGMARRSRARSAVA